MKVQYVSICPTEKAIENGCHSLTPELLAATGARYSRNNEGLDSIVSNIDPNNLEKSVDNIFKMLDYGHASIADMVPISLFIDNISLFAAYYLWTLSPTAGGQESSTRYIKINKSSFISSEDLGIHDSLKNKFNQFNHLSFNNYQICLDSWNEIAKLNPSLTKIPDEILNSNEDKNIKAAKRMIRNYSFDRARVYLPLTASTGVMMIQSARAWANIAAHLQSHYLKELKTLGKEIAEKLSYGANRLLKHSQPSRNLEQYIRSEYNLIKDSINSLNHDSFQKINDEFSDAIECKTSLFVDDLGYSNQVIEDACKNRVNRYSPFGNAINRTLVRFCWIGISFGEIRDLNRHRTGNKYCPLVPLGFYSALDQLPEEENEVTKVIKNCSYSFMNSKSNAIDLLNKGFGEYIYFTNLGHQYYFEHSTTADKFLYEMELRTGLGAHYKYAEHCHDALKLWFDKYPETKKLIFEGKAEPE